MKTEILKPGLGSAAGLLLTLPTACFILISIFKYALGWPALFDSAQPLLESWGIAEAPGWNINLLILFGPMVAFALNAFQVLSLNWETNKTEVRAHLSLRRNPAAWVVIVISSLSLLTLFVYGFGENCSCR